MPRRKLRYELCVDPGIEVEQLIFEAKEIDLAHDRDPRNPRLYKNQGESEYYVFPSGDQLGVFVLSQGSPGKSWALQIWLNGQLLRGCPIEKSINMMGRGDYDKKISF